MATKTISLRVEAYEKLRRTRLHPGESFSDVVPDILLVTGNREHFGRVPGLQVVGYR